MEGISERAWFSFLSARAGGVGGGIEFAFSLRWETDISMWGLPGAETDAVRCDRDTITVPTDAMFDLMKNASRGDDVYGVRSFCPSQSISQLTWSTLRTGG